MSNNADLTRRWYKEVWKHGGEGTVHELMAEGIAGYMEASTFGAGRSSLSNGNGCLRRFRTWKSSWTIASRRDRRPSRAGM